MTAKPAQTAAPAPRAGAAGRRGRRFSTALWREKATVAAAAVFTVVVVLCLLAPVYAADVAHTSPDANHILQSIVVDGHTENVVSLSGIPIGPTWHSHFFLGADALGRDVAVRLLYGGRNSLEIGFLALVITLVVGLLLGTAAGYFRGWTDGVISRLLELVWAYPVLLLGLALGTILSLGGLDLGIVHIKGNSLLIPALIIGVVYVPYFAKVVRAQCLTLRGREFIDAAKLRGDSPVTIIRRELFPALMPTVAVMAPLLLAQNILLEAGLSYLGVGVQEPAPSWGNMIGDGIRFLPGAFHLVVVPGIAVVVTVFSINVLANRIRQALDPRSSTAIISR